ncbi:MAG: hypothetical protein JO318_12990 [Chloroflexi bacterium]|nr:hypothetical protein [Chloroflexota bacterium]
MRVDHLRVKLAFGSGQLFVGYAGERPDAFGALMGVTGLGWVESSPA